MAGRSIGDDLSLIGYTRWDYDVAVEGNHQSRQSVRVPRLRSRRSDVAKVCEATASMACGLTRRIARP